MEPQNNRSNSFAEKWNPVYFFMPLFENPAKMPSLETFQEVLTQCFGTVHPLSENPKMPQQPGELLGFALENHKVEYKADGLWAPSQLVLYGSDRFDQGLWDEMIVSQFWDCPQRQAFMPKCGYSILCSNLMAAGLPRMEQYGIIARYAQLILRLFPDCIGIYWPHSQKLMTRERMSQPGWNAEELYFLDGGLNVRFFNISGTDGEMLFDTMGLTPIGLPDLQCHCKGLEPNDVVLFLRNLAAYLYQQGDVIEDGNTVEGIDGGKWKCRREDAMVKPLRMVLDINAGQFAAGNRHE